eukprot:CAMPEP_0114661666 /NCGR_PEP_ID=MMETSP0191-20121206/23011_1 /TAXON_ID=126664 /ORGANISM="Sorites sp." /LENGTH=48 /DNA_ID= /DNA_START= /DNA_END= /DNA_ORIENTATION=
MALMSSAEGLSLPAKAAIKYAATYFMPMVKKRRAEILGERRHFDTSAA